MPVMLEELLLRDEVYAVVGAAMEVYRHMREGFAEAVYQEAMEIELSLRQIPYTPKMKLPLFYKGRKMQKWYEADICCYGKLILELKATDGLIPADQAQLINYLKATNLQVGVLLNFGCRGQLQWKRMVRTQRGVMDPDESVD